MRVASEVYFIVRKYTKKEKLCDILDMIFLLKGHSCRISQGSLGD